MSLLSASLLAVAALYAAFTSGALVAAETHDAACAKHREQISEQANEPPATRPAPAPKPGGSTTPEAPAPEQDTKKEKDGSAGKGDKVAGGAAPALPMADVDWPYPEETWIVYRWLKLGTVIGTTRFRISRLNDATKSFRVEAQFDFDGPGRSLRIDGASVYDAAHQPVSYDAMLKLNANGQIGLTTVGARFDAKTITVNFEAPGSQVPQNRVEEMPRPSSGILAEDQAFEHFALLAPVLATNGAGEYDLIRPSNLLTFHGTKFTPVREEDTVRGKAMRWSMAHPRMQGDLWIDAAGSLVKYRQGELEIVRDADEPVAAETPKGKTNSK